MRVQIVSFRCVLKNKLGQFISSSVNQEVVTTASHDDEDAILPDLVEGLRGLKKGQKRKINVAAERAYGFYDPKLVVEVSRTEIPRGRQLRAGDSVKGNFAGEGRMAFRVVSATSAYVMLDGNHPLAGQDLVFDVEVTSSRTEFEEIENKKGLLC